ncbi:MAG: hypothetical protein MUC60_18870 [Oscillatoria sp. Prado101]|nr:hypothetical protein [Oscillatoria sp. Prado101]
MRSGLKRCSPPACVEPPARQGGRTSGGAEDKNFQSILKQAGSNTVKMTYCRRFLPCRIKGCRQPAIVRPDPARFRQ